MKAVLISLLISQIIPTVLNIFNIIYSTTGAYRRNYHCSGKSLKRSALG
jgi:hypothetical protein